MNKSVLSFVLGTLAGAAGGSIVTYYIVDRIKTAEKDEELENYAEHCEERVKRYRDKSSEGLGAALEEAKAKLTNDPEEAKIEGNKGVKKYHHGTPTISAYCENHIFEKEKEKKDSKLISYIEEDEYMNYDKEYTNQIIDVFVGDDNEVVGIWGYLTDTEEFVDRKFGKPLEELIGTCDSDFLISSIEDPESKIGSIYVRNDDLMIDFEIIIHDNREEDK